MNKIYSLIFDSSFDIILVLRRKKPINAEKPELQAEKFLCSACNDEEQR